MSDEKKMKVKENKGMAPGEDKTPTPPPTPPQIQSGNLERGVMVRFYAKRAAEGVVMDAERCAVVSRELAQYLVSIGYAEEVGG